MPDSPSKKPLIFGRRLGGLGNFGFDAFRCKIKVNIFFMLQISTKYQFAKQSIGNF